MDMCTNVDVIEAAVSRENGTSRFTFKSDPTNMSAFANSLAYEIEDGVTSEVRLITIDTLCSEFSPDLIKIDIEGAEFEALQGAEVVLREASPVLIVAIHPDPLEKMGSSPAGLIAFLDRLGYAARHLDGTPVRGDVGFEEIILEKMVYRGGCA